MNRRQFLVGVLASAALGFPALAQAKPDGGWGKGGKPKTTSTATTTTTVPPTTTTETTVANPTTPTWTTPTSDGTSAPAYYVDATNGSDSNNGTDPSTPWQTIAKVNGATLVAGDTVLFKRGEVWRGLFDKYLGGGSAGNPITYDAYGTGAKPVFSGGAIFESGWTRPDPTNYPNIWRHAMLANDGGGHLFFNETVAGNGDLQYVHGTCKYTALVNGDTQGTFYSDAAANYLWLWSASDPATYYDTIEWSQTYFGSPYSPVREHGLYSTSYITVRNLHFTKCGYDVFTINNSTNCIFEYNEVSFAGGYKDGSLRDGQGLELWNACSNTIVRYNTFHDITNVPISIQGQAAITSSNIQVYGNTVYNSHKMFELWPYHASAVMDNIQITHNVAYNTGGGDFIAAINPSWTTGRITPIYGGAAYGSLTNVVVTSNIFHTMEWCFANVDIESALTDWTIDYNSYYPLPATFVDTNVTGYTFAQWKTTFGKDANSISSDPLLTSVANRDFSLGVGSPCIGAGVGGTDMGPGGA